MQFLRKTLVATTLTWLAVVFSCTILNGSGGPLHSMAVGIGIALPAWPLLFVVLVPMMAAGEFLGETPRPAAVPSPARRIARK
jgi:hypothetical protein